MALSGTGLIGAVSQGLAPIGPIGQGTIEGMGLSSSGGGLTFKAIKAVASGMMKAGNSMMNVGTGFWDSAADIAVKYLRIDPKGMGSFGTVSAVMTNVFMAIASSLVVLFFVMGWLRESIDIRNNFTLENMFRFFVRFAIASSLIVNSFWIVYGVTDLSVALVKTIDVDAGSMKSDSSWSSGLIAETGKGMTKKEKKAAQKKAEAASENYGYFGTLYYAMDSSEETEAWDWFSNGLLCFLGGLIGGLTIMVCGVQLIVTVMQRLFKMLLCIPFAPVAFAGFAGGEKFSQSGVAWIKTFLGYALEASVMVLAISVSFGLFNDSAVFTPSGGTGAGGVILNICGMCLPMITACACVKGADTVVRRCLGLG